MEPIKIYTSRKKAAGMLMLLLLMTVCAEWAVLHAGESTKYPPLFIQIVGIIGVLFCGFGVYVSIVRLVKNRLMLVVDGAGIDLDPRRSPALRIGWGEIDGFSVLSIRGAKIIVIHVKNPKYWIDHETNAARRKMMEFNLNHCGAPFNITAGVTRLSHNQLWELLNVNLLRFRENGLKPGKNE